MEKQTFGQQIRKLRESQGLSQHDLALRLNLDPSAVARIELRDKPPRLSTVRRYADALGVDVSVFTLDFEINRELTFGERVRYYRKMNGWTQWDLARKVNRTQSQIVSIEGSNHDPQTKTLKALAKAFGITMDELVNGKVPSYKVNQGDINTPSTCSYCGYVGYAHSGRCPQCNAKIGV